MEDSLGKIVCTDADPASLSFLRKTKPVSLEQSPAIVLRVYPWSETSLVVTLYAREFGKLSVLAKGARRPKSPFEAALDLLSICRVVFIAKSGDSLDILTEAKLEQRFRGAENGLLALYCGYYVAELVDRLTDKGEEQTAIYDLALNTLLKLQATEQDPRAVILRLELGLLRLLGHLPSWRKCTQCGSEVSSEDKVTFGVLHGGVLCESCRLGARNLMGVPTDVLEFLEHASQEDWRNVDLGQYPEKDRAVIRGLLRRYLETLLDRQLQLHAYLEELGR